ncbi:MAG: DUF1194 domain-containing protein [Filomicrobium sp.]
MRRSFLPGQNTTAANNKNNLSQTLAILVFAIAIIVTAGFLKTAQATEMPPPFRESIHLVDTALILAVDTSQSVDETRFRLQMDGIAAALEDAGVINTILGGPRGAIALQLVTWSDHSTVALPWTRIASKSDADVVASRIRRLPRLGGEYTCMGRMFRNMSETIINEIPYKALKTVIDVSGDGIDNCEMATATKSARNAIVAKGIIINGLPIIVDRAELVGQGAYQAPGKDFSLLIPPDQRKRQTLADWFEDNVIGGYGAFSISADGYGDFARAMRSKFLVEISLRDEQGPAPKKQYASSR